MAADRKRFAERLRAARTAMGLDQAALAEGFAEKGYAKSWAGKLEREEIPEILGSHIAAAEQVLGFPRKWFTEADPRTLFGPTVTFNPERVEVLEEEMSVVRESLESYQRTLTERLLELADDVRQQHSPTSLPRGERGTGAGNA